MTAVMIEAALRALIFAVAVGASLRLLRVSNVPVRKAAWSAVLIASLAMPFLMRWPAAAGWAGRFGWAVPIRVKQLAVPQTQAKAVPVVLLPSDEVPAALPASTAVTPSLVAVSAVPDDAPMTLPAASTDVTRHTRFPWPPAGRLIAMMYLAVSGALLLRLLWGLVVALRLWMTADLVSPLIAPEPHVRSSRKIPSPVTIGSGIVLPATYTEWDMKKLKTVLAHERSHVRQFDFYLQVLAGLYTALFWFSPLGWWLRRTLTSLGEAIGDRAGIDAAASRSGYAEILLEFAAMPRQTLPGVAMARPGNLAHRVERLLNEHLFRSAFAEGRRRAVVSLLLLPVALFAATALIRVSNAAAQTAPRGLTAAWLRITRAQHPSGVPRCGRRSMVYSAPSLEGRAASTSARPPAHRRAATERWAVPRRPGLEPRAARTPSLPSRHRDATACRWDPHFPAMRASSRATIREPTGKLEAEAWPRRPRFTEPSPRAAGPRAREAAAQPATLGKAERVRPPLSTGSAPLRRKTSAGEAVERAAAEAPAESAAAGEERASPSRPSTAPSR